MIKGIEATYNLSRTDDWLKAIDALMPFAVPAMHDLGFVKPENVLEMDEKRGKLLTNRGLGDLKEVVKISMSTDESVVSIQLIVSNRKKADAAVRNALALQMEMSA